MPDTANTSRYRFILNPMGSAGDVHPYLGIATRLIARGHDVIMMTDGSFRSVTERLGIPFEAVGIQVDWQDVGKDHKLRTQGAAWKESIGWAAINPMRQTYVKLKELNEPGRTCVVSPVWSFAARLAGESLGMQHANCVINSMVLRSAYRSPLTPLMYLPDWMPRWMKRYEYWWADRLFIDPVLKPELNRFRKELGLRPVSRLMHRWWFSPDLVLGLFHDWFTPPQPDWPKKVTIVGHPRWDPTGDQSHAEAAIAFAKSGTLPVLFVPGSVGPGGIDFFRLAAEACQTLGLRAIFLDRNRQYIPDSLPEAIRHFDYVPLKDLAPHCAAMVHSGCAGTLHHAMAAGIGHVVCPRVNDQFDNAARLHRLGLSANISAKKLSAQTITAALQTITTDASLKSRAQSIALKLQQSNPLEDICNHLEQLMHAQTSQHNTIFPSVTFPTSDTISPLALTFEAQLPSPLEAEGPEVRGKRAE